MRPAVARPVAQRLSAGHAVLRVDLAPFPGPCEAFALPGARWHGQASCSQAFCTQLGLPISLALLLEQTLLASRVLGLRRAL